MTSFPMRRRTVRSVYRRGLIAFALVLTVLLVGTLGMALIEGYSLIDAFYFMAMLATAQGPASSPSTVAGKLFASLMAFVSVGTVVASLGFLFGPFFGAVWRVGVLRVEEEEQRLRERGEKGDGKQGGQPPET